MAILFVESLSNNKNNRVLQIAVKALEIILLTAGLISTIVMVKGAVLPYSCEFVFSSLIGIWNSIKCFLSSPLYICIIINFMVVLIQVDDFIKKFNNNMRLQRQESDQRFLEMVNQGL
ncbi:hypothetical protein ACJIZ3_020993 [Penstemon smallii]|uniref:Uncharacterized protein n=1 Tax=Penstemon smallii TaxID=265156 RepID=A0ABD3SK78_9LAMI